MLYESHVLPRLLTGGTAAGQRRCAKHSPYFFQNCQEKLLRVICGTRRTALCLPGFFTLGRRLAPPAGISQARLRVAAEAPRLTPSLWEGSPVVNVPRGFKKNEAGPCPSRPSHLQLPRPLGTQALRKPLVLKQGFLKKWWVLVAQVGAAKVRHPTG